LTPLLDFTVPKAPPQEVADIGASMFGLDRVDVDGDALAERFDPTPDPYTNDPVGWIEQAEFIWSVQQAIAESVREHRYTAVPSAHDTGKSYIASRLACWWIDAHKPGEAFAVTTAPTWNQVHAILWREMRQAKSKRKLPGRTTLDARWYVGGKRIGDEEEQLVAFGRKPADYDQAAFQGIHAKYVLVIIDEASGVPRLLYDAVDSLATNINARVLAIGNPDDPASQFAEVCRPGSGWNVIPVSAFDTPAYTGEEVPDYLPELLVSREWVEERKKRWGEESPTYQSKVLGRFPEIGEDTLIQPKFLRAAQDDVDHSGVALKDKGQYGVDVARYGSNKTVIYRNRGGMIRKAFEAAKTSTTETAGQVAQRVKPHQGGVPAVIDEDGVGGGVVDILREQQIRGVIGYRGGMPAQDKDRFVNRRAELYWTFKEAVEAGEVDLDPEDDQLAAQLGSIRWKLDSRGRIQIESKDDMAKRGVASPDHADAAVQSWLPGQRWGISREAERRKKPQEGLTSDLMEKDL
jgi:hypothetical protein